MAEVMNFGLDFDETPATEAVATEEKTEKVKRDPLAKYNALSEEGKSKVDEIVNSVVSQLGDVDDPTTLDTLLGVLDKLNQKKKEIRDASKAKAKEDKELAKAKATENGKKLATKIKAGDTIDYYMATSKIMITNVKVEKVTAKGVRFDLTSDLPVIHKGKNVLAGDVNGVNLGMKSAQFAKILKVNGKSIEEFLAD